MCESINTLELYIHESVGNLGFGIPDFFFFKIVPK